MRAGARLLVLLIPSQPHRRRRLRETMMRGVPAQRPELRMAVRCTLVAVRAAVVHVVEAHAFAGELAARDGELHAPSVACFRMQRVAAATAPYGDSKDADRLLEGVVSKVQA